MTRSPIGLLILVVLGVMALLGAGAISWAPTAWETHAANVVAKSAGRAAKTIGVQVHIPPSPPWETPAPPAASASVQRHTTAPASTPAQETTTLYPTGTGAAVAAPQASPAITAAYCELENIPSGEDGCP